MALGYLVNAVVTAARPCTNAATAEWSVPVVAVATGSPTGLREPLRDKRPRGQSGEAGRGGGGLGRRMRHRQVGRPTAQVGGPPGGGPPYGHPVLPPGGGVGGGINSGALFGEEAQRWGLAVSAMRAAAAGRLIRAALGWLMQSLEGGHALARRGRPGSRLDLETRPGSTRSDEARPFGGSPPLDGGGGGLAACSRRTAECSIPSILPAPPPLSLQARQDNGGLADQPAKIHEKRLPRAGMRPGVAKSGERQPVCWSLLAPIDHHFGGAAHVLDRQVCPQEYKRRRTRLSSGTVVGCQRCRERHFLIDGWFSHDDHTCIQASHWLPNMHTR